MTWLNLVALESRLASVTVLSLCFAAAFGLHGVWGALDQAGRNLVQNPKYIDMLNALGVSPEDRYAPLTRTEKVFRVAIWAWLAAGIDTFVALTVAPLKPEATTRPTLNVLFHVALLFLAGGLSARAWFIRMNLDRQVHRNLRMAEQHHQLKDGLQNPASTA